MKKIAIAAVFAAATVLATQGTAQAESRPSWSSSGLSGVAASGHYSKSGSSVHFYGNLYDTAGDNKAVALQVRFSGEASAHDITNSNGNGTSVPIDLSSTRAAHVDVRELKGGGIYLWTEGPWVRIY